MAKIKIVVEVDTDELFREVNQNNELDREKFDALVLTADWQAEAAGYMWRDFLEAQEQDASCLDEGLFAEALVDFEE